MTLSIYRFLAPTDAEGPGTRACLWVQGCERHCPGCFNRESWPREGGAVYPIRHLLEHILNTPGIEGVTFAGGEPFLQARALATLGRRCREAGLGILTFTGYTYGGILKASQPEWQALLDATDLLLAGPYLQEEQDFSRPWVGSRNQEFVFLTPRYHYLQKTLREIPNRLELRVEEDGAVSMNGLAPAWFVEETKEDLKAMGLVPRN